MNAWLVLFGLILLAIPIGIMTGFIFYRIKKPQSQKKAEEKNRIDKKRGVSTSNGSSVSSPSPFFKGLAEGEPHKKWWFPSVIALVSYVVVLFFSYILLPGKIWDFWIGTTLCWLLLAIFPLFVLGIRKGGIVGKVGTIIGAAVLLIIGVISVVSDENFNSTFGETEAERRSRVTTEEVARQEEFLARQPVVTIIDLTLNEWVLYEQKPGDKWSTEIKGCVAVTVNNGPKNLVCNKPDQRPKYWPFTDEEPESVTYFISHEKRLYFMALDEPNKLKVLSCRQC